MFNALYVHLTPTRVEVCKPCAATRPCGPAYETGWRGTGSRTQG